MEEGKLIRGISRATNFRGRGVLEKLMEEIKRNNVVAIETGYFSPRSEAQVAPQPAGKMGYTEYTSNDQPNVNSL